MARRNDLLAELSRDAALERSDFLVRSGEQLDRFIRANAERIRDLGGLTLIDDDPDYLAVAPDGTFRSRTRVFDESRGDWISETEVIEAGGELVELYNPSDIFAAFAEGARGGDGEGADGEGSGGEHGDEAGPGETGDLYGQAADRWAAGQPDVPIVTGEREAAAALYDLALEFQERSQRAEAGLLEQFENAAGDLLGQLPTFVVVDDLDERLEIDRSGFRGRVIPEGETGWHELIGAGEVVRFYDPTDVFGDLADAIAEAHPEVAPDDDAEA